MNTTDFDFGCFTTVILYSGQKIVNSKTNHIYVMLVYYEYMQNLKKYLGYLVIIITIVGFGVYLKLNPAVIDQLRSTKISTIVIVLFLYSFMTGILIIISKVLLRLSDMVLSEKENALMIMYSSVVNFFGPLQSGPGFRVVYLKKKHDINIRKYLSANVVYYSFFALISGSFILSGVISMGYALLLGVLAICIAILSPNVFRYIPVIGSSKYFSNIKEVASKFRKEIVMLALLTATQLVTITGVYFVELKSIDASVQFWQAIIYAGAANLSLFVSLTPGALGFRESFLFFSQRLHQINSDTIVAASILDRALFVLFLALMMLVILLVHGKQLLSVGRIKSSNILEK